MTGETESTPLLVNAERDEPDFREHRLADVRTLGVSFFFLFGTQSTIATLSSTLLPPSVAFFSYGSLYLSFALFNALAAARIVSLLGVRKSLFVAAITYLLWSIANVLALKYAYYSVLVPVAVLNGLGASVLWTAQSLYLARCALPQTLGAYSGAFFACMWASGIIGPLFSSSLLRANVDKVSVFEAVIAISLISLLLLAYLWLARPEPSNPGNPVHEDALSGDVDLLATARLLVHPSMLLLMPLSYIIGFEQAFYGSSLPLFIKTDHPQADLSMKLYLRAALGFVITMTALMIGRVTDKFGSRPWVLFSLMIHVLCQGVLFWGAPINNLPALLTAYGCVGVSNGVLFNQAQKLVGTLFVGHDTGPAYAAYKFHTSVGTALCFFFSSYTLDASGFPDMRLWAPLFLALAVSTVGATFSLTRQRAVYHAI